MIKVMILFAISLTMQFTIPVSATWTEFCKGYERGYDVGWCYEWNKSGISCIEAVSPICPVPDIGESTWEDGHSRGFVQGHADWIERYGR